MSLIIPNVLHISSCLLTSIKSYIKFYKEYAYFPIKIIKKIYKEYKITLG